MDSKSTQSNRCLTSTSRPSSSSMKRLEHNGSTWTAQIWIMFLPFFSGPLLTIILESHISWNILQRAARSTIQSETRSSIWSSVVWTRTWMHGLAQTLPCTLSLLRTLKTSATYSRSIQTWRSRRCWIITISDRRAIVWSSKTQKIQALDCNTKVSFTTKWRVQWATQTTRSCIAWTRICSKSRSIVLILEVSLSTSPTCSTMSWWISIKSTIIPQMRSSLLMAILISPSILALSKARSLHRTLIAILRSTLFCSLRTSAKSSFTKKSDLCRTWCLQLSNRQSLRYLSSVITSQQKMLMRRSAFRSWAIS